MENNENEIKGVIDFDYSKLEPLIEKADKKKENIILLTTGSFNPIHRMHLEMLNIAYRFLLSKNKYNIICGFISPSSDSYVSCKKPPLIPFEKRCDIIETAIKEYNKEKKEEKKLEIYIHLWEGTHDYFIDFPYVIKEIQSKLMKYKIRLIYVCGMDLFLNCRSYFNNNVIVIDRKPYRNDGYKNNEKRYMFFVQDDQSQPFSSTSIREYYLHHDYQNITNETFPEVSQKIIDFYNYYYQHNNNI